MIRTISDLSNANHGILFIHVTPFCIGRSDKVKQEIYKKKGLIHTQNPFNSEQSRRYPQPATETNATSPAFCSISDVLPPASSMLFVILLVLVIMKLLYYGRHTYPLGCWIKLCTTDMRARSSALSVTSTLRGSYTGIWSSTTYSSTAQKRGQWSVTLAWVAVRLIFIDICLSMCFFYPRISHFDISISILDMLGSTCWGCVGKTTYVWRTVVVENYHRRQRLHLLISEAIERKFKQWYTEEGK